MACINMFSPEQHQGLPMSPRISFSNDFAVEPAKHESLPMAPADPDFEFAVGGLPMMEADELFCKGRLLPLRERGAQLPRVTLRDELLVGDDDEHWDAASPSARPLRGRWKGLLGLRKPSYAANKDKGEGVPDRAATLMDEEAPAMHAAKPTQDSRRSQGDAHRKENEFAL